MSRRKKKEGEAEGETEGGVERRETKREDAAEVNGRGGGVRPVVVSGKWKEQTCALNCSKELRHKPFADCN